MTLNQSQTKKLLHTIMKQNCSKFDPVKKKTWLTERRAFDREFNQLIVCWSIANGTNRSPLTSGEVLWIGKLFVFNAANEFNQYLTSTHLVKLPAVKRVDFLLLQTFMLRCLSSKQIS